MAAITQVSTPTVSSQTTDISVTETDLKNRPKQTITLVAFYNSLKYQAISYPEDNDSFLNPSRYIYCGRVQTPDGSSNKLFATRVYLYTLGSMDTIKNPDIIRAAWETHLEMNLVLDPDTGSYFWHSDKTKTYPVTIEKVS